VAIWSQPNKETLEALVEFLFKQGMIEKRVAVEELFAPA
jgi:hypothetical protein